MTERWWPSQFGAEDQIGMLNHVDDAKRLQGLALVREGRLYHLGQQTAIPRWSVLDQQIPLAGIAHNCGTVRFGSDPADSELDVDCKAHELDNLYVVDTSFFPSSSAVNPALTAIANSLRVGDHLLERLGARAAVTEVST